MTRGYPSYRSLGPTQCLIEILLLVFLRFGFTMDASDARLIIPATVEGSFIAVSGSGSTSESNPLRSLRGVLTLSCCF